MARLFEIPPQKPREIDYQIINKIKAEMFPNDAERLMEESAWSSFENVEFGFIDKGRFVANRFAGMQMKTYAGGTVIRKVMIKDGKIDIDQCLKKFAELKEIKRKYIEWNQKNIDLRNQLSAEVDQFIKDMAPMPPGFVVRTYGDNRWVVKYEADGLSREKAARIVEAIREAMVEGANHAI